MAVSCCMREKLKGFLKYVFVLPKLDSKNKVFRLLSFFFFLQNQLLGWTFPTKSFLCTWRLGGGSTKVWRFFSAENTWVNYYNDVTFVALTLKLLFSNSLLARTQKFLNNKKVDQNVGKLSNNFEINKENLME